MIHTVFSTDATIYLGWQAELLAYTFRQVDQPGPLTRLWSADEAPPPFDGLIFQTQPAHRHPSTGDWYPPYNRTTALVAWLRDAPPVEETILHIEPDFIFTSPVIAAVKRGAPIAHPFGYMDPALHPTLVRRHTRYPERVQPIGVPKLIHRDDLAAIAPLWLSKTEDIRNDPLGREEVSWVSDMWAYVCAAADLGLHHEVRPFGHFANGNTIHPLIHYCYGIKDPTTGWQWDKRHYTPWTRVPSPPPTAPYATRVLIRELNAYADLKAKAQLS